MNKKYILTSLLFLIYCAATAQIMLPAYQGAFAKQVVSTGGSIVSSGLVLHLDAGNKNSYNTTRIITGAKIYSVYAAGLRSANYTVQYSDDNSNWTTAFTGVMSNNSSCGFKTGSGVGLNSVGAHRYWRYVEGSSVVGHHPRTSRIILIDSEGAEHTIARYTDDNCSDLGGYQIGTVSYDFTSEWTDLSGNSNHGTLINGPTYSSANGESIVFDGVNDRVSSFPTQISGTGSKTISMWIKINTTARTGLAGIRSTANWGWGFTVNRTTIGNLTFYDTNGSLLEVAAGLTTSIWYNVSVTYNSATSIATLFLNGYQIGSLTNFTALNASTFNGVIGNEDEPVSSPFNGSIAQVIIYNRALTAAEVLQNFNALRPRFGDVTNPTTGKIWMDRNLGASRVATSSTDANAYGDFYQWGRGADGHQIRTSTTTTTLSLSDVPGNANFILAGLSSDWRSTPNNNLWQGVSGTNNPCPAGFRIPTEAEWIAEMNSWSSSYAAGAFASPLKLPVAGARNSSGTFDNVGIGGNYWSSTIKSLYGGFYPIYIWFDATRSSYTDGLFRAYGLSVRCIKD